jgi:hypothetical protein
VNKKTKITWFSVLRFTFCTLIAIFACITGCAKLESTRDPLAGWTFRPFPGWEAPPYGHNTNHLDKAISDDYQSFISTNKLATFSAITGFYEDGTGQHAIEFEAFPPSQNATWHYVLIYDKENKRVKLMKYDYRSFQS